MLIKIEKGDLKNFIKVFFDSGKIVDTFLVYRGEEEGFGRIGIGKII